MRIQIVAAPWVFAAGILLSMTVHAQSVEAESTPCARAAQNMKTACFFDVRDDKNQTIANCRLVADRAERRLCFEQARQALPEETESCIDEFDARREVCDLLGEFRYLDPLLDESIAFIDPNAVGDGGYAPNPYVSIKAGHTFVLRAGEDFGEIVVVHVTDEVREIQGVDCRVVADVAVEAEEDEGEIGYAPIEVTDDWFAQDDIGNVYYCGENSRDYENDVIVSIDGSFESGVDFARSGVLIQAFPMVDVAHRQEFALGEAEDLVEYLGLYDGPTSEEGGENVAFPCEGGCLKTRDSAALEPESTELKYYLPNTGFVLAVAMEDGEFTGEREELVCVGDSLDILEDEACAIDNPEALLETLCELSPAAFCED